MIQYKPITYNDYVYPDWSLVIGFCMALSSVICIPVYALYKIAMSDGTTFLEVRCCAFSFHLFKQLISAFNSLGCGF